MTSTVDGTLCGFYLLPAKGTHGRRRFVLL